MNLKLEYVNKNDKDIEKSVRRYVAKNSMNLLNINEINQYFTGCTYKCIPPDLKNVNDLLVLLGHNFKKDKF